MKAIVITSIFPPTEAVRAFAAMGDSHHLIVVGDRKTPADWAAPGATYLSVGAQENLESELLAHLPFNHYCRKMLGYLEAISRGAQVIVDTDDDNIPKAGWRFPPFDGEFDALRGGQGFFNIYQLFTGQHIWPRGHPLDAILERPAVELPLARRQCAVGVWQGLADEDPDVDAIYRLTSDTPCHFDDRAPVVLGEGTISPFNSQNTAIRRELFPLLYLPVHVTFRFTDILRGLVAQPIMAALGYQLGFLGATVVQKRNPHDYLKDFESEIPMYRHSRRVPALVGEAVSASASLEDNLRNAYSALRDGGVVTEPELAALEAWLRDVSRASNGNAPRPTQATHSSTGTDQ